MKDRHGNAPSALRLLGALLAILTTYSLTACGSETDAESAEAALDEPARGGLIDAVRPLSLEERTRLISPDPVPPPVTLPLPDGEPGLSGLRDAYWRVGVDAVVRLVVQIDRKTPVVGGAVVDVTTLAGPGSRISQFFVPDGVECAGGVVLAGATVLIHIPASDVTSPSAGATRIQASMLGGALTGILEARILSAGEFEVSFPWGPEVLRAADLGGAL